MISSTKSPEAAGVKMNTRLADLDDITSSKEPVVLRSLEALDALKARKITVEQFQDEIHRIYDELDLLVSLKPWIDRALGEKKDQVLYRKTNPDGRIAIQLFYIEPFEVHPPHCHHNIVSMQVVLHGLLRIREFDRIARIGPDKILMKMKSDGWCSPGHEMRTTESLANCHWFAAGATPSIMLNFNAYGYQDWTFDPADTPFRRKLVDPTFGKNPDGLIIAREVGVEEAYQKFGGKPLTDFQF